jgi:hypothetical protein
VGTDFNPISPVVTFAPGSPTAYVAVSTSYDSQAMVNPTLTLTVISDGSGNYTPSTPSSATSTLVENSGTSAALPVQVVDSQQNVVNAPQNLEGDSVNLQVQAASPINMPLSYSATNLPAGLSINYTTGAIIGTVASGDATAGYDGQGDYITTITATDGTYTGTTTLFWTISHIMVQLADQQNSEGDSVNVQVQGRSSGTTPLTYSATNLPAGLSINYTTGAITGTVDVGDATGGDGAGSYITTITATDGTYTGTTTVLWSVAAAPVSPPPPPSPGLVFTGSYDWNGVAAVTTTVTQAAPGDPYLWDYHVTNESFASGIASFAVPVEYTSMVSNLSSSVLWSGAVGSFMGDSDLVAWQAGAQPTLGIGASADFTFTTAPTGLAYTNGIIAGPAGASLTDSPGGLLVVPIAAQAAPPQAAAPAVLVATEVDKNTPNKGLTSLREAIRDVNLQTVAGLSRVRFTNGMDGKTITLGALGTLTLSKDIMISTSYSGQPRNITLARDPNKGAFSLFTVTPVASATIEGLILTDGGGANVDGGAVNSSGDTALVNCKIHDNGARTGAGVYSDGRFLALIDCQVYHNMATGKGGGIAVNAGSLLIKGCSISGNSALNSGGGIALGDGVSPCDIFGSGINGNTSIFGMGGGIYVAAGTQAPTTLLVVATTISGNLADGSGGGIAVGIDGEAVVTLLNVGIIGNNRSTIANGGGLYVGSGTLWSDSLIVTGNSAGGQGGGLYIGVGTTWSDGPNQAFISLNTPNNVFWEN